MKKQKGLLEDILIFTHNQLYNHINKYNINLFF